MEIQTSGIGDDAMNWQDVIEQRLYRSAQSMLFRVCSIEELTDREDIRVGDQLCIRSVEVNDICISLTNYDEDGSDENDSITIPSTFESKCQICPHYPPSHAFKSIRDILDTYPSVHDILYSTVPFAFEEVEIPAWDIMQIITVVQDTSSDDYLEVKVLRTKRHLLFPASLKINFLQWKENWTVQDNIYAADNQHVRTYSICQLKEFWKPELRPMKFKLCNNDPKDGDSSRRSPTTPDSFAKKFIAIFKSKEKLNAEKQATIVKAPENNWMIPEKWRSKTLIFEPVFIVNIVKVNDPTQQITLPGSLKMKVQIVEIQVQDDANSLARGSPVLKAANSASSLDKLSSQNSWPSSEVSLPIHQLDITTLVGNKGRNHAIVGIISSGSSAASSRQQGSLSYGSWVALHRTRRVRKLLMVSQDTQHFLVSAYYGGSFKRLPLIYNCAGDVLTTDDGAVYVTRCTSYPVEKLLDPCCEGQFVRFTKFSFLTINEKAVKVVHALVSSRIDGLQHAATYPMDLRGRFERIEVQNSSNQFVTHDLFRDFLPVCVQTERPDLSLGFDLLSKKKSIVVKETITEMTVIVEILRKTDDAIKPTGILIEMPIYRGTTQIREVPSKLDGDANGIDPIMRRSDFKGLQKLLCVELLAERDITDLRNASRRLSSQLATTPDDRNVDFLKSPFSPGPLPEKLSMSAQHSGISKSLEKCFFNFEPTSLDLPASSKDDLQDDEADAIYSSPRSQNNFVDFHKRAKNLDAKDHYSTSPCDIFVENSVYLTTSPLSAPPRPAPRRTLLKSKVRLTSQDDSVTQVETSAPRDVSECADSGSNSWSSSFSSPEYVLHQQWTKSSPRN